MPRRNNRPKRRRRLDDPAATTIEPDNYQGMAHRLVKRGLASPQVLGPVPYGRKQQREAEARGDA